MTDPRELFAEFVADLPAALRDIVLIGIFCASIIAIAFVLAVSDGMLR